MVSIKKIGISLGGLDIPSVVICDKGKKVVENKSFSMPSSLNMEGKLRDTLRESQGPIQGKK